MMLSNSNVADKQYYRVWMPGHAGVEGSEMADRAARVCNQSGADIDMKSAMRQLRHFAMQ